MATCNDNKLRVALFLYAAYGENGRKSVHDTLNLIEKKNTVGYDKVLIVYLRNIYVITSKYYKVKRRI